MRGTNAQPRWSIVGFSASAGHFALAGGFSIQTTAFAISRRG